MVVFAVNGDECDQPALRIQPKRFAAPREVCDAEAFQFDFCISGDEFIRPAVLDRQFSRRKSLQLLRATRRLPLANEHHLKRCGSVPSDGEELRRPLESVPNIPFAHENLALLNEDSFVQGRASGDFAMDFHRTRHKIAAHSQISGEWHILATVVEMEIDGQLQFVTILLQGVLFFADGLFKLVKAEVAFFD